MFTVRGYDKSYGKACTHSFRDGTDWRTTCYHCGILRSNVKKQAAVKEEKCEDCSHPMSEHEDADCAQCHICIIDRNDALYDQLKEEGFAPSKQ